MKKVVVLLAGIGAWVLYMGYVVYAHGHMLKTIESSVECPVLDAYTVTTTYDRTGIEPESKRMVDVYCKFADWHEPGSNVVMGYYGYSRNRPTWIYFNQVANRERVQEGNVFSCTARRVVENAPFLPEILKMPAVAPQLWGCELHS